MSANYLPPRPWTWALDPEEIDVDGGSVAVLSDADGVEFLRSTTEHADELAVIEHIVAAVNEVTQWREGGVTEELLRRHNGSIHLGKGCTIVRTEDAARSEYNVQSPVTFQCQGQCGGRLDIACCSVCGGALQLSGVRASGEAEPAAQEGGA